MKRACPGTQPPRRRLLDFVIPLLLVSGCATHPAPVPVTAASARADVVRSVTPLDGVGQLVLVTTSGWNATTATLSRWERDDRTGQWRQLGAPEAAVVGRAGLAWANDSLVGPDVAPVKREGDGRAPAGIFPLDTIFGFQAADVAPRFGLPYLALQPGSECVDDPASRHYNTIVDRSRVGAVDWASSERMREISQYRRGVTVGYNVTPPRAGRGSCIFLHIWAGPQSVTFGCTAFDAGSLEGLAQWLRRDRRPMLVQLTQREFARLQAAWGLPTPTS